MHIRSLRPADAEEAFHLRVTAFSAATRAAFDPAEIYIPDEHRLVAVDGRRVIAHAGVWPVHQVFGGRPVPMGGLAAVVVAQEHRGAGVGSQLIAAALDHMDATGMVISSLFPSTPVPYHRWGWEFAGDHVRRQVATRALLDVARPSSAVELRPYGTADLDALVDVADTLARSEPGGLIGGRRWLARALQTDPDDPEIALVAVRDGRPVGLAVVAKTPADDSIYGLDVLRLFGVDRDVERALLRSIGHHHTAAATTVLRSRPADPLLFELTSLMRPDPRTQHFMTRLVDVSAAIAARGWSSRSAAIELTIVDDRRPSNSGRFVLEVADRSAALTRGGSGGATIDVGALASLYTGFATARGLAAAGRLRGHPDAVALLDDVFVAPAPFMRDTY